MWQRKGLSVWLIGFRFDLLSGDTVPRQVARVDSRLRILGDTSLSVTSTTWQTSSGTRRRNP